ncbi:histone-like nucleoid-structuring protein Lsr2 [Mariniluteicoccus flavus]
MAQRVQVILEDDVDGGEAAETVRFALDGVDYEIDLSEKNARKLRDDFAPWTGHGRKVTRSSRSGGRARAANGKADAGEIRAWAQANGMEVNARGRVPAEVREAYERANA